MAAVTDNWATFAVVSGGAAAALTGLLFVAVSIRIEVIARSKELRSRAAQTLTLFATVLVVGLVLAIPDQAPGVVGAELIATALFAGAAFIWLGRRAERAARASSPTATGALLDSVAPNAVTAVLLAIAGVLVALGLEAGLYVLVVPVVAALLGGIVSAWLLLAKLPDEG
jgi:hypothetical protein